MADLRRMRRRSRTIEILHDPQDDVRVLHAIRRRCGAGSRRLLVVPDPSGQDRDLRRDLLRAFGELPSGWRASRWSPRQLALFPSESWPARADHPGQLALFPRFAEPAYADGVLTDVTLDDLAELLLWAGMDEVWVLRAHTLAALEWGVLRRWATRCGVRLRFVVHGRRSTRHQQSALEGCRVVERPLAPTRPGRDPWWARPSYRHRPTVRSAPPMRMIVPPPRRPVVVGTPDLEPVPIFERFRAAAAALMEQNEGGARTFLVAVRPSPAVQAVRRARITAIWRDVIARLEQRSREVALDEVAGVGVERLAPPVVVRRRPGIGVGGGPLQVAEGGAGVEAEGDERMA